MDCLFNSCDTYYKRPFGALPAGQTLHLALTIPQELGYVDPHLVLQKEGPGDVPVFYRMNFDGQTPGINHFSVDVQVHDVGLYFYYFDLILGMDDKAHPLCRPLLPGRQARRTRLGAQ